MKCSKCGNEIIEGMQFCNKCGARVEKEENVSNQNPMENNTNNKLRLGIGDIIWYIGTSIILCLLLFNWIGVPLFDDTFFTVIYVVVVVIDTIMVVCISNFIKNKFVKYIVIPICAPIIVVGLILFAMAEADRETTEQINEAKRPYVEAKRQRLIEDMYNRRFH